jgi:hypothetical protein
VRTPPATAAVAVAPAPAAATAVAAATAPQLPVPAIHPRVWHRRQRAQVFTIPETEDWGSEANQAPSALPIRNVNWENDWSRRCVCGARPGRCHH